MLDLVPGSSSPRMDVRRALIASILVNATVLVGELPDGTFGIERGLDEQHEEKAFFEESIGKRAGDVVERVRVGRRGGGSSL